MFLFSFLSILSLFVFICPFWAFISLFWVFLWFCIWFDHWIFRCVFFCWEFKSELRFNRGRNQEWEKGNEISKAMRKGKQNWKSGRKSYSKQRSEVFLNWRFSQNWKIYDFFLTWESDLALKTRRFYTIIRMDSLRRTMRSIEIAFHNIVIAQLDLLEHQHILPFC